MSADEEPAAPYRIETERLVLRCWDPRDAPLAKEAVDESIDHLRPWMPWAHDEPQPIEQKAELFRRFRGEFDLGEQYVYGLFTPDESEVVGGAGLHRRVGPRALEIGYWIRVSRVGQGVATEVAAALTRVAFAVCGVDRVEIHVEPGNAASLRIPRKLGFTEEAALRRRLPPLEPGGERRDVVIFTLFRDELDSSPLETFPLEAFDAAGVRLL